MITLPDEVDGHRVRVGCDVVAIQDVQDSLAAFGDRYLRKVFTASEINDCRGSNRVHRLAARFAAKEAVIKAFAEPDMPFPWREIEVTRDGPLPLLRLSGTLAEQAQHQGWASSSYRFRTPIATQWRSFSWSAAATPGRARDDAQTRSGTDLDDRRVRRRTRACRGRSGRLRHRSRGHRAGGALHGALVVPFFLAFLCRRRDGHPVRLSLCRSGAPGASLGPGLRHRASGPHRIGRLAGRRHRPDSAAGRHLVVLPDRTVLHVSAGAAVLRNRNAQPGTSVAATALPGHDFHTDRLRPGFCAGRTRPSDTALALLRRICAVRTVESYCHPAAPCRVSSPALRIVAGFDEAGETNTD